MLRGLRLVVIIGLALVASAFTASSASADVYVCEFTGNATVSPSNSAAEARQDEGVEAIVNDLGNDEGDGGSVLTDTDNGNGSAPDGTYSFTTQGGTGRLSCLYMPTGAGAPTRAAGVYLGMLSSAGGFDNVVCGTGSVVDQPGTTTISFGNPAIADIVNLRYTIGFAAGLGRLDISDADNADGETGSVQGNDGIVTIGPTNGNCTNDDVSEFLTSGTFTIVTA